MPRVDIVVSESSSITPPASPLISGNAEAWPHTVALTSTQSCIGIGDAAAAGAECLQCSCATSFSSHKQVVESSAEAEFRNKNHDSRLSTLLDFLAHAEGIPTLTVDDTTHRAVCKLQPWWRRHTAISIGDVESCTKCGGSHCDAACPHFLRPRDDHPDAHIFRRAVRSNVVLPHVCLKCAGNHLFEKCPHCKFPCGYVTASLMRQTIMSILSTPQHMPTKGQSPSLLSPLFAPCVAACPALLVALCLQACVQLCVHSFWARASLIMTM